MRFDRSQRQRRRVRVANAALVRVRRQRDEFATAYGQATTSQARFNVAAHALRGAAAAGRHQPEPNEVDRRLDQLTDQMTQLLDELHTAQQAKAHKAIAADQARIARRERTHRESAGYPFDTSQSEPGRGRPSAA